MSEEPKGHKVRMTDKWVITAKPDGGGRTDYFDLHTVGLMLRVSDSGTKSWAVRYRTLDGRQRRHALGRFPGLKLADARAMALDAMTKARQGADPSGERTKAKVEARAQPLKTFADLSDTYFTACETGEYRPRKKMKRATTLKEERGIYSRHLQKPFAELRIEEVTTAAIKKVLRALVTKGQGVTSNRVRALVRQMMNFAISEGRITSNPVAAISALGTETARQRVLADSELKTIWAAIRDTSDLRKPVKGSEEGERIYIGPAVSIALRLLLLTLTRRSELAGMRTTEIDLKQATWTIPGERTKNGRPLLVPLSDEAVSLIRAAMVLVKDAPGADDEPTTRVFPSPRDRLKSITPASLSHALRDLRLALQAVRFTPHDFRRTAASAMASERLKITPFLIGRLLNHTSETGGAAAVTVTTYALYDYASEKRSALAAWERLLLEIVGEREPASNVREIKGGRSVQT